MAIGRVVARETQAPLANVRVSLLGGKERVVDTTRSDSRGVFYLTAHGPGKYRLQFTQRDLWFDESQEFDLTGDAAHEGAYAIADHSAEHVPTDVEVDQVAAPLHGNNAARYPTTLRSRGVEGAVLEILSATAPEFTAAVLDVLPRWRFQPAVLHGSPTPQVACMPSLFQLTSFGGTPDPNPKLDSLVAAWPANGRCPGFSNPVRQPTER
jgi:hypothetical protein